MGAIGKRICCCGAGPGSPPPGGYCPTGTIVSRSYVDGEVVIGTPFVPAYVPAFYHLSLPESIDLSDAYEALGGFNSISGINNTCEHPFSGTVELCPDFPRTLVLSNHCEGFLQSFWSDRVVVETKYRIADAECIYSPVLSWIYVMSDQSCGWGPGNGGSEVGWPRPGKIFTVLRLKLPVLDTSGRLWWLYVAKVAGVQSITWPTHGGDAAAFLTATLDYERQFLEAEIGEPSRLFRSPWSWIGLLRQVYSIGEVEEEEESCWCEEAYTPIYRLWRSLESDSGSTCDADTFCDSETPGFPGDELTIAGIEAQAGDDGDTPTDGAYGTLYMPATIDCPAAGTCASCAVELPGGSDGFGSGTIAVNCFPPAVSVSIPAEILVAWRGDSPCSYTPWGTTRPDPWTRHPESPSSLFLATACESMGAGTMQSFTPWHGVFSTLSGTSWQTNGFRVSADYTVLTPESAAQLTLHVGFVLIDPTSVTANSRRYQLFTAATLRLRVQNADGSWQTFEELYAVNRGPVIVAGDHWDPGTYSTPQAGDEIRQFGEADNPWLWEQDFDFRKFYHGYVGTPSDDCETSYPPDAYLASQARTATGEEFADYCESSGFVRCVRTNHVVLARVSPAIADATDVEDDALLAYCSDGAPCETFGGMMMMAAPAAAGAESKVEGPRSKVGEGAGSKIQDRRSKIEERRVQRLAICEACPSGQWVADGASGPYCQHIYQTCKCTSPGRRAVQKTAAVQQGGICPKGHF